MEKVDKIDGFFSIIEEADGVYLTVFPPLGGKPVKKDDVVHRLRNMGYMFFDTNVIDEAIKLSDGKSYKIVEKRKPPMSTKAEEAGRQKLLEDDIEIEISPDGMKAYISFDLINKTITKDKILEILRKHGVVFGILEKKIEKLLKEEVVDRELIARGIAPVDGKDAYFIKKYTLKSDLSPRVLEDGRVDYRELDLITCVNANDVLLEKVSAKKGRDGRKVTGEIVRCKPGRDLPFPKGKNVRISDDRKYLISEIDGAIVESVDGKINVEDLYIIDGDVDFATGNIYHIGALLVKGDVREGFKIICNGDIEVLGSVEGAIITSKSGSVSIHKGIKGQNKGIITAAREVSALFMENIKIIARGDVKAKEGIINSDIMSGGEVVVNGKKAVIVGGVVRAERAIRTDYAGSNSEVFTVLKIESFNATQIYAEVMGLEEEFKKVLKQMLDLKRLVGPLLRYGNDVIARLPEEQRRAVKMNLKKYIAYKKHLQILAQKKNELVRTLMPKGGETVMVKEIVYPKVSIVIRGVKKDVKEELRFVRFIMSEGQIKILPFES